MRPPLPGLLLALALLGCEARDAASPAPPQGAGQPAAQSAGQPAAQSAARPAARRPPPPLPPEAESRSPNADVRTDAQLRAELAGRRDAADGGGRAWFADSPSRPPVVAAGSAVRLEIVYEAGSRGVSVGGSIAVRLPSAYGFTFVQHDQPNLPGYVTAATDAKGVSLVPLGTNRREIAVRIEGRALRPGERVRFVYGAGAARALVQVDADRAQRFAVLVDGDGDGRSSPIAKPVTLAITPGRPDHLFVAAPATARPGEKISVRVSVLDDADNDGVPLPGEVRIVQLPAGLEAPGGTAQPLDATGHARFDLVAAGDGIHRLVVQGPAGLSAASNPIVVGAGPRVLFADLHGHSHLSDGAGTPEDYFRYARDVAGLDVAVLTDHDHYGTRPYVDEDPKLWRQLRGVANRFHDPGRFVTMPGFEWTSWIHGHRHVLHFADDGPLVSAHGDGTGTPRGLFDALRGLPALTFAHHSAGSPVATNWAYAPDPELEPLTEIVSIHGSSESSDSPRPVGGLLPGNTVRDVLDRGFVLGFVGSGDSHSGHPGCAYEPGEASCGLAAILSEDLDRASVLAALRARRSYATNGPRIVLDVRLGGAPMGASVPAGTPGRLAVSIVAEKPLQEVALVREGGAVEHLPVRSERELHFEREVAGLPPGGWLYLRVVQIDGGAAWSSPFFYR